MVIDSAVSYTVLYIGGGVALLYASEALEELQTANFDQKIGVQIIQNALKVCTSVEDYVLSVRNGIHSLFLKVLVSSRCLIVVLGKLMFVLSLIYAQTPVHTIASNAGVEGAVVVGKLLEQDNPDLGYDAAKGQYCISPPFSFTQQNCSMS